MVALRKTRKTLGRYITLNYVNTRNELAGCFNDGDDWAQAHAPYVTDSKQLREHDATKAGIIRFVTEALKQLDAGDRLLLQLSGHGTQVPDLNSDEPDRFDEAFCPYDLDKHLLFDDEIYSLLSSNLRHADSEVLLITDCCHSGSMARTLAKQKVAPRFIPFDHLAAGKSAAERRRLRERSATRSAADGIVPGVVHLSGCKDNEVSFDARFNGRANGALSRTAIDALGKLEPGATYVDWYRLIRKVLPSRQYSQTPQINCVNEMLGQVLPGFELGEEPIFPPPASDGPGHVQIVVDGWRSKRIEWERS